MRAIFACEQKIVSPTKFKVDKNSQLLVAQDSQRLYLQYTCTICKSHIWICVQCVRTRAKVLNFHWTHNEKSHRPTQRARKKQSVLNPDWLVHFCFYRVCESFGGQTSLFKSHFQVHNGLEWMRCYAVCYYQFWVVLWDFGFFRSTTKLCVQVPLTYLDTSTRPQILPSDPYACLYVYTMCCCIIWGVFDHVFGRIGCIT